MSQLHKQILALLAKPGYQPLKPKALFRKVAAPGADYDDFKNAIRDLLRQGQLEMTKSHSIRPITPTQHTVSGTFRKTQAGHGFVRPAGAETKAAEIYIPEEKALDAVTGDVVQVRVQRQTRLGPRGEVLRVLERATRQFVGTYFEREGAGYVRIDGTVFAHSVYVGDPGVKGAKPEDKVVLEMVRFPNPEDRGEAVITEVLGPRGKPGVDTLSIIRALGLPEDFPEDVLAEARLFAASFREEDLRGREDFTGWTTITIDPPDAKDFDDAVSLTQDPKSKHWLLSIHIADVGHFAPPGSAVDREARKRATSVYLPQRVIPMFPELISNSLASLQQGKVRLVKSVLVDLTPLGQVTHVRFANAAVRVKRRFAYEQVSALLADRAPGETGSAAEHIFLEDEEAKPQRRGRKPRVGWAESSRSSDVNNDTVTPGGPRKAAPPNYPGPASHSSAHHLDVEPEIVEMLFRMRDLAVVLHKRRVKRGALELNMPEIKLDYDQDGRVAGAHFAVHDISHQIIEEFMLMANECVAGHLDAKDIDFLRRVHPAPDPAKLRSFAEFARILGYKSKGEMDRFTLQRILRQSANRPEMHAVHYALLRSLKQATYSPMKEEHYALASQDYCHFTSPIRRYPDLVVHRLLDQLIRRGRVGSDRDELIRTGEHCSKMERRAELAERELVKLKLLTYMTTRLGAEMEAVITGVADYGFYAQAQTLPVEGLVHISTLPDDYYYFDDASYSLHGQRHGRRYRLGDKVHVQAVRVDLQRRQLDFRVTPPKSPRKPKK
ncbi:MAG: RNB domain-containing ribonuclease [Gemmataceae bacterium]